MTYWLEDANGYVGDLASTTGLKALRESGPPALVRFLTHGGTDDPDVIDAVRKACTGRNAYIAEMLASVKLPVIVTDGSQPVVTKAFIDAVIEKYNHNHDPKSGRFESDDDLRSPYSAYDIGDEHHPSEGLYKAWRELPLEHRQALTKHVISMSEHSPARMHGFAGTYNSGTHEIRVAQSDTRIAPGYAAQRLADIEKADIASHELGHALDHAYGQPSRADVRNPAKFWTDLHPEFDRSVRSEILKSGNNEALKYGSVLSMAYHSDQFAREVFADLHAAHYGHSVRFGTWTSDEMKKMFPKSYKMMTKALNLSTRAKTRRSA